MKHLVSLPFDYWAAVLPSSCHRNVREEHIREYTDVLIPEVEAEELRLAILIPGHRTRSSGSNAAIEIFDWRGTLYRQALARKTGKPLDLKAFEDAVSPRFDHSPRGVPRRSARPVFDHTAFPSRGVRWGIDRPNPLCRWNIEHRAILDRWTATKRIVASEREHELAHAQSFLEKAVISVAGQVFVACPEPVWCIDAMGADKVRVRLEVDPRYVDSYQVFRLDRLDHARDWAHRVGGDQASPRKPEIFDGDSIRRNDEWALATWLVTKCQSLRSFPHEGSQARYLAGNLVQRLRAARRLPTWPQAEEILDALVTSIEDEGFWAFGDGRTRLELVRDRWLAAKSHGTSGCELLDAVDLEALAGLADEPRP